jgi:hypothetical protein
MSFDFSYLKAPGDSFRSTSVAGVSGDPVPASHYVRALAGGIFVVAWTEGDASKTGVYFQRFGSDGQSTIRSDNINSVDHVISVTELINGVEQTNPQTSNMVRANSYTLNEQERPRLLALPGEGFAMVWESWGQDGKFDGIQGNAFNWSGSISGSSTDYLVTFNGVGNEIQPVFAPIAPSIAEQGFVVAWTLGGTRSTTDGIIQVAAWDQNFDRMTEDNGTWGKDINLQLSPTLWAF